MNPELLVLVPLVLAELAVLLVALLVLWCLVAGVRRRRAAERDEAEGFAAALDARRARAAARRGLDLEHPLDRLQAEYEAAAAAAPEETARGFEFCDGCMKSTPHTWRSDDTRRCISCKHTSTVGGTGE
ncbi:hypothetical protein ACFY0G_02000 [Streptomyces sp. NPDC001552]|uniref:hypothetical protein n=1 Tax=Streptomyces sp. NPDC001552 TaxID=3364587 RepID=UPI0036AF944A